MLVLLVFAIITCYHFLLCMLKMGFGFAAGGFAGVEGDGVPRDFIWRVPSICFAVVPVSGRLREIGLIESFEFSPSSSSPMLTTSSCGGSRRFAFDALNYSPE
ncbi:hypothetical protein V8C42DRAFT_328961 [Trichoderma barbatum]